MRSPTLLLIRMNAADTSASSAIADWTPLTVVSRSSTTEAIETFISDVSTTSTNMAAASSNASLELCGPSGEVSGCGSLMGPPDPHSPRASRDPASPAEDDPRRDRPHSGPVGQDGHVSSAAVRQGPAPSAPRQAVLLLLCWLALTGVVVLLGKAITGPVADIVRPPDNDAVRWFVAHRSSTLTEAAQDMSLLADFVTTLVLTSVLLVVFWF